MKYRKLLITGCGGMLGNAIYPYFKERVPEVVATDIVIEESEPWLSYLDVREPDKVSDAFKDFEPDLVLHLAAITNMEVCENDRDNADVTNSTATRAVAELAERAGATLVYISTGGVFDGEKDGYYDEDDTPNPIAWYGETKLEGEHHIRAVGGPHYILRPGWMVGGGRGIDHKFIWLILQQLVDGKQVIHAVNDKWGTPTYTHDFAMNLFKLLDSEQYGTYHMVCKGKGTRFDVAKQIMDVCNRSDVELKPVSSDFFEKEFFATRPNNEMLINKKLEALGINIMRPWREAIRDYLTRDYADFIRS